LPPPATLACLRGVPTYYAGIDAELVTPTGAAIIKTLATEFTPWPTITPDRIGWGRGSRELPDRPNALRVVLGDWVKPGTDAASHVVLEANVDDMTGELVAHAIESLMLSGALDAWAVPVVMKKGRPGLTLAVLTSAALSDALTEVILRETTTIGVRRHAVARTERPRRTVRVETPFGPIDVKFSEGPGGPTQVKPEFAQCAAAARAAGVPARQVVQAALTVALESLAST
jgi:uncharacterized protein (DUF111 family)